MTFKVFTLGCKLNRYESEFIRQEFLNYGLKEKDLADIYVADTCAVTKRAQRKSLKLVKRLRKQNPHAKIASTGCFVQIAPEKFQKVSDYVFSLEDKPYLASRLLKQKTPSFSAGFIEIGDFSQKRAFLKIQDGCNKHCSFCLSRLARGKARNRPFSQIREELLRLLDKGFSEIVLVGLDLGSWQEEKKGISWLIAQLSRLMPFGRLRLSSLDPKEVNDELLAVMEENDKICPHLHLSFQSADSKVLKDMGRDFSSQDCFRLAENIRRRGHLWGVSCDIMYGFPTETESAFDVTLDFLEKLMPVKVHAFLFSPHPLLKASRLSYAFKPEALLRRRWLLLSKAKELSFKFRLLNQNTLQQVVFDKEDEKSISGYTGNYIRLKLRKAAGLLPCKKLVEVKIKSVSQNDTWAEVV